MRIFKRLLPVLLVLFGCFPALSLAEGVTVDFDYLTLLNEDCIGWLYQPESGLSQPVMQHETDDWYHERAFDEVKLYKLGSVYLHADASLTDPVIVVHGQAREEGCLSLLPSWREAEYFEQHTAFQLLTPGGNWQANAFACLATTEQELNSWLPAEESPDAWAARVKENSLVYTGLPTGNEHLLFIAGHHPGDKITLVIAALAPGGETGGPDLVKLPLDRAETLNGMVDAGPAGQMMYYAQNDPLYSRMYYESGIREGVQRDFGGGGCGPTAMAIIAANLVQKENLPLLGVHALNELGNQFCPCSVNRVYCDHSHVPYRLQTPEEYLRYLPVAMGDFAAGNNRWEYVARRVKAQGTNVRFVDYVCETYGLTMTPVSGLETALEMMKQNTGEGLIMLSALRGSPYTNNSHFVVLTGVDEEYMYILDPLRRTEEEYLKTDTRDILELLSPGVTRIRLENYARSDLSPVCYIAP